MAPTISQDALLRELQEGNAFFDSIVDMGQSGSLEGDRGVLPLKAATTAATATAPATPVLKSPPPMATPSTPPDSDPTTVTPTPTDDDKSRKDALRAKLHAKLAEKRGQRPITDPNIVSKRAGRAAEKKERQEEAKAKKEKKGHTKAENGKSKSFYESSAARSKDPSDQDFANLDFANLDVRI